MRVIACVVVLAVTSAVAQATVIYVDDDAAPGGDGLSWNAPFAFMQDALAYAGDPVHDVTQIRVAQGVHAPDRSAAHPGGTGDPTAFFDSGNVVIKGGYAGIGSPDPGARDIEAFQTIFSGDLTGDDLPGFVNVDDNSVILFAYAASLDGCTIRSAFEGLYVEFYAELTRCRVEANVYGVHLAQNGAQLHAAHCVFDGNRNAAGGSLTVIKVEDCAFTNQVDGALGVNEGAIIARNCVFSHNSGGAIGCADGAMDLRDCEFVENAAEKGGALFFGPGAGGGAGGRVVNCVFRGNTAVKGGAVYSRGRETDNDPRFINCVFFDNEAELLGGGLFAMHSTPKITNCTFARNQAFAGGGVFSTTSGHPFIYNSIIRGNPGGALGGPGLRTVRYSDIGGGHSGAGNIDSPPMFVDEFGGDLRLRAGSPCIDAGRNAYVPPSVETDAAGQSRFADDPRTPDEGADSPPVVDMGAHEFQPQ